MTSARFLSLVAVLSLNAGAATALWAQVGHPGSVQDAHPRSHGTVPQDTLDDFIAGFNGDAEAMDRAMKATGTILAKDPENVEALAWNSAGKGAQCGASFQSGDFKTGMKMWQESKDGLNKAVELAPENTTVRIVRGKSMLESSLHDPNPKSSNEEATMAVEDLEKALALMGDNLNGGDKAFRKEMYAWLYQAASKAGDKDKAAKYKELAGDKANDALARLNESAENTVIESARAALVILDSPLVQEIKPDLMAGLRTSGKLDAVIASLDGKIAAKPDDAAAQAWRGFTRILRTSSMYAQGRIEEAGKAWERGVNEINAAASTDATSRDAALLRALGDVEKARRETDADKAAAMREKALSDLGRFQRLVTDGNITMTADAKALLAITNARVHLMARDTKKARASLDAAVAAKPSPEFEKRAKSLGQFVEMLEKK